MSPFEIGELTFQCRHCWSADLHLPDDATESSVIVCNNCGKRLGTVAEAKAEAARAALDAMPDIERSLKRGLGRVTGFKPN